MSWLPAVCLAGRRHWLPLSRPATDLIAAVLLQSQTPDGRLVAELACQLKCDPPLAIFAAIQSVALQAEPSAACRGAQDGGDARCCDLPIDRLARECLVGIPLWFAAGDAFLGVPQDRDRFIPRWLELHAWFVSMPRSNWMKAAQHWLEVAGPEARAHHGQSWPTLADDDPPQPPGGIHESHYAASKLDLSLMARTLRRAKTLATSFSDAVQDAKQAALKQLAYGLSHEINNPLANISARAQGLMRDEDDPRRRAALQRIVDQSMRAHEMVADLMFFSHPPAPHLSRVELAPLLDEVADQLRPSIADRGIDLRVNCPDASIGLQADRAMLSEAIRALLQNSVEAVGCEGRIELKGRLRSAEGSLTATILVRDSGPGLSESARRHAFDPYFSGREAGRGLGVGLCRVKRVATLHGGDVSLASGPAGCTARLWIPVQS